VIHCLPSLTMSLPVRRLTHTAPRTLARISRLPTLASRISVPTLTPRTPRFSTMATRLSAAPAAPSDKSYDPEIQDMASYIHDYKVDSDLAVSEAGNRNPESS
jgi:2-methylcitrate dehydratase